MFASTKVHLFFSNLAFFGKISTYFFLIALFNISESIDLQYVAKKLQKRPKKKQKKKIRNIKKMPTLAPF